DILMPQLGESVTEGTITRWFKQVGDAVAEDEPLFEVSTDKVDTEVPSPHTGTLSQILVAEGDTVDVGTVLAVLGDGSEAAAAPEAPAPAESVAAEPPAAEAIPEPEPEAASPVAPTVATPVAAAPVAVPPAVEPPTAPSPSASPAEPIASGRLLSPLVRRLVEENQLDPAEITGTGVGGRITREDVLAVIDARAGGSAAAPVAKAEAPVTDWSSAPASDAAAPAATASAAPAPSAPSATTAVTAQAAAPQRRSPQRPSVAPLVPGSGDRVEQLNNIRRVTGDAMIASKAAAPHAITIVEVDYEAVEKVRQAIRPGFLAEEGFSLTYLPFISRAVVDALREFPHMNASMGDGSVVLHDEVHLSVAVDLDYEGLLAPVVRSAHDKRLRAIARDIHELADRARNRTLQPDDLSGGTFTLSNSGSFGTAIVIPIINQPQVAILSTDGVSRKPVVVTDAFGNESIGIHSVGNLTLSWDHRAFDGAYAAAFTARVKEIIETRDWETEF
ncbi:MAG TPA: dihydrolipoamide acetyltransferase family protein, partial [Microthrixaceae bacterium]|nr:dihydrolipoamide acetyltransferase family protein [Microthrixaceae bacterium]